MNKLIELLDKKAPFFEKVSNNKYLKSVMNGFMGAMYLIIFSSLFLIVDSLPVLFGTAWPEKVSTYLTLPHTLTMGFLGFFLAGSIAKSLVDEFNRNYDSNDRMDVIPIFVASLVSYMLMVATFTEEGAMNIGDFGTSGLFVSIIVAIITVHIFKFAKDKNLTINLPKEVPPHVSSGFKVIIAFSMSVSFFWLVAILIKELVGIPITTLIMYVLMPIFDVGNTYFGLFFVGASISILTYIGIHGTSVVGGAIYPMIMIALGENQAALAAGQVPSNAFAGAFSAAIFGGSGATLAVTFMFAFLAKSKANKAVGRAAIIPGQFKVNEPILFGAPILANPIFLIPYVLAPGVNAVIYKLFVEVLGMPGASVALGMGIPDIIAMPLGHNFAFLTIILVITLLIVDSIIYYPFFKAYDDIRVAQEAEMEEETVEVNVDSLKEFSDKLEVLVLCVMGGTSGFLANSVNKGAKELGITNIKANASQVATINFDTIGDVDMIVLAPQARTHYDGLLEEATRNNIKLVTTDGERYVELGGDPMQALDFVINEFKGV